MADCASTGIQYVFNRKQKEETPFSLCEQRRQTVHQPHSYSGLAWHVRPPPATLCHHFCMPALVLVVSDCWGTKATSRGPHSPLCTPLLFPNGIVMCLFSPMNSAPLTSDHIRCVQNMHSERQLFSGTRGPSETRGFLL